MSDYTLPAAAISAGRWSTSLARRHTTTPRKLRARFPAPPRWTSACSSGDAQVTSSASCGGLVPDVLRSRPLPRPPSQHQVQRRRRCSLRAHPPDLCPSSPHRVPKLSSFSAPRHARPSRRAPFPLLPASFKPGRSRLPSLSLADLTGAAGSQRATQEVSGPGQQLVQRGVRPPQDAPGRPGLRNRCDLRTSQFLAVATHFCPTFKVFFPPW